MEKIVIILAAFNGEKFISEQIDSILAQSYENWELIIFDDKSTDRTLEIIREYSALYSGKIKVIEGENQSSSAKGNFIRALKSVKDVDADYFMFSDQDDVWLTEKIEKTLNFMKKTERENPEKPVLIHTDLAVVSENLEIIKKSMFKYQGLDKKATSLNRLLAQNNITGCTMMMNKKLFEKIDFPDDISKVIMHDWWIGLIAAQFGVVRFIKESLIYYRQHGENVLGAVNNRNISGIKRILKSREKAKERIYLTYRQAKVFGEMFGSKKALNYAKLMDKPKFFRILNILRYNFTKQNFLAIIGQIIFC